MSKRLFNRTLPVFAVLIAVLFLFTFPIWNSSRIPYQGDLINSDVTELNFPARFLLAKYLKERKLPIWNPYIGSGFPQLAEGQAGMLYPLNLALFFVFNPVLAFNLTIILSLLLALIFSYLLFRLYGFSRPASLFSSIAFTFSGFTTSKLKFTYLVCCMSWIPLAIYGVEKSFARNNYGHLGLTTLALTLQLLAGGPQIVYITLSAVLFIFMWRYLPSLFNGGWVKSRDYREVLTPVASLFLACLLAAALSAPQLVPGLKGLSVSTRGKGFYLDESIGMSLQPGDLSLFVSPFQRGNPARNTYGRSDSFFWENIAYPGLLTLILALVALLFLRKKNRSVHMWSCIGFLALAISMGKNTPLAEFMWRYVPGFKLFRFWQRYLILTVLSLSFLGGLGFDLIITRFRSRRFAALAMCFFLTGVLLADLLLFAHDQYSTIEADRMLQENRVAAWLEDNLSKDLNTPNRIESIGEEALWNTAMNQARGWMGDKEPFYSFMESLSPNHNLLFGLRSFTQYGDYGIYRHQAIHELAHFGFLKEGWKATVLQAALNILALHSVRYLVTPFELEQEGLIERASWESGIRGVKIRVYEIAGSLKPAYIVQHFQIYQGGESLDYRLLVEAFRDIEERRNFVILERFPLVNFGSGSGGEARITRREDLYIRVEASSPGGILVLNETFYPEWHVFVDGVEKELLRANLSLMGVELEPGEHLVEFRYRPDSLYYGLAVAAAGLLLLLLLSYYAISGRKKRAL